MRDRKVLIGKKWLAWLLTLVMVVSMGMPAFAEEGTDTVPGGDVPAADEPAAPDDSEDACAKILASMSTEDKISMMIMPAFRYWTGEDGSLTNLTEMRPEVAQILQKRGFSGVILFAQNTGNTEKAMRLVDEMQKANATAAGRTQLLIAIDQEGGIVTRLGQGTQTPGNMALGAVGDIKATEEVGKIIGSELKAMGINYDAAPVVDVNNNPSNPVIGVRSFSDDPKTVAEHAVSFMKGLQSEGVISNLKHFPGHGDTGTDSHTGLPSVNKSYEQLKQTELVPFQACIDEGAEAIMTAHIQYPQIETDTYISKKTGEAIALPATLSDAVITDILRKDMGFDGVVITDAMEMAAINDHFGKLDAARLAINAGVDIILMPTETKDAASIQSLDQYVTDVAKMADGGQISMEKVDAAVLRILKLKEKKGLLEAYDGSQIESRIAAAKEIVGSKAHHDAEWEIAKRAITLVKNKGDVLPLTKDNQKIQVLIPTAGMKTGLEYGASLAQSEGRVAKGVSVSVAVPDGSTGKEIAQSAKTLSKDADHIVIVSNVGNAAAIDPAKTAWSAAVDQVIAYAHSNGKTVTLMSVRLPYDAARYQAADAILMAWSFKPMNEDPRQPQSSGSEYGPNMPAAMYMMLTGEAPEGKLPVNVPAVDGVYHYTAQTLYPRGYGLTWTDPQEVCPRNSLCPISKYTDSDPNAWYHDGVHWALEEKIMNGTGETTFEPAGTATRAMIVTMLWRMEGEPDAAASGFADVEAGSWYEQAVNWAAEKKIVSGYDEKTFGPNDMITREQLATMLFRYSGAESEGAAMGLAGYDDAGQISDWAKEALLWAVTKGIINGTSDTTLEPKGNALRAQVATMLMRSSK
ncbi:MAG: S-layer homology domain-containing protein [Firmicutes bacterium]|nr:S-layer homology domain-containing protein [Bacillota bacterium]